MVLIGYTDNPNKTYHTDKIAYRIYTKVVRIQSYASIHITYAKHYIHYGLREYGGNQLGPKLK
jgi:hypothetical protein